MHRLDQRGFSILEAIAAVSVTVVVALALSRLTSQGMQQTAVSSESMDLIALKQMVRSMVSCEVTFSKAPCSGGNGFVKVYKPDQEKDKNRLLISNKDGAPTFIGVFALRALCSTTKDGILVEVSKLKPSGKLSSSSPGDFHTDAVSKAPFTWRPLFGPNMEICPGGSQHETEEQNGGKKQLFQYVGCATYKNTYAVGDPVKKNDAFFCPHEQPVLQECRFVEASKSPENAGQEISFGPDYTPTNDNAIYGSCPAEYYYPCGDKDPCRDHLGGIETAFGCRALQKCNALPTPTGSGGSHPGSGQWQAQLLCCHLVDGVGEW